MQKPLEVVKIQPPPAHQRHQRAARFAGPDERRDRYHLPSSLDSSSPVGYRTRVAMTQEQAQEALALLSLERPTSFEQDATPITEAALFEECSLGILSARQSTNYRGHKQATFGPERSKEIYALLKQLSGLEAPALEHATHTHLVFSRPYRTPFTLLLTFIGHKPIISLATVGIRALQKRILHYDDIPTIGYLQQIHLGILADAAERAAVIASSGARQAQLFQAPFCGKQKAKNQTIIRKLQKLGGLSPQERSQGWRLAMVIQVGQVAHAQRPQISASTYRAVGANLMAFRSERIQPGVNQEDKAPEAYQQRQDMDVPDELTVQCGRAAYNAFVHWTDCDREHAKDLLLNERIDVLTPNGKERLRQVRDMLNEVTERVMRGIPLWADLPTLRAFSKNAARGKKAFALAGQRVYIGGLDRHTTESRKLDWALATRALGAAAARGALFAELMGVVELPDDCDLLAGICLMAGPVNQNDIGKSFYGQKDLLAEAFPDHSPTSMLVWTLKAKTVADPIGNEEQLLNPERKGALVDLRPGPHEVIFVETSQGKLEPMRKTQGRTNTERAFSDAQNFVTDDQAQHIPGNLGAPWPAHLREGTLWSANR